MGERALEWIAGVAAAVAGVGIVGIVGLFQKVTLVAHDLARHLREYDKARDGHERTHEYERNEAEKDYQHLHAAIQSLRERLSDAMTNEKLNAIRHEENSKRLTVIDEKLDRIEGKK